MGKGIKTENILDREFKSVPQEVKAINDRTVTGVFAVYGVVDLANDRLMPGAFSKTIEERGNKGKVKHLWQHDFFSPPIAVVMKMSELTRAELPDKIKTEAPDASGGVEVVRKYLETQRADEVLKGLESGAINEMSFGFDAIQYSFEKQEGAGDFTPPIRNLSEVRIYDTSDVLWGMNPYTTAIKSGHVELEDEEKRVFNKFIYSYEAILKTLEYRIIEVKSGSRHSKADDDLLDKIHKSVVELGSNCERLKESQNNADNGKEKDEAKKSQAVTQEVGVALTSLAQRLSLLELETFNK